MKSPTQARKHLYRLLAGAVALALPSVAFAQGQIDAGRANDASNRVGSFGKNQAGVTTSSYNSNYIINTGNQVVTGNVSNGREFHGNVGYSDPTAFRGVTAGSVSDNFVKNSSGVPRGYAPPPVPNTSVPFYGASQTAAPPAGFVRTANGAGYVPAPATTGQRGLQDQRLGIVDLNQPMTPTTLTGDMILRGSLSPDQAAREAGVLTGSSLYGVREWNLQDPADRVFLENLMNRANGMNRPQLDPRDVQRMRDELQKALEGDQQRQQPGQTGTQQDRPQDALNINPYGRTFEAPSDPNLASKPLNSQVQSQPINAAGAGTDQGIRYNLLTSGAARRTSTQYAELNKRLEQYYADRRKTDADFAAEFNKKLREKQAAEAAAAGKKPNPNDVTAAKPNTPDKATAPEDITKPKVKKPAPMKVTTLSQGVKAEGIAKLLRTAEGLMKEGKFASALDQYEAAEVVAPNDPMIWLGKANAELGAGFFGRADQHLRQALTSDRALLMAQYDLTAMIGEDRLAKVVTELKDTANKEEKKPMAPFLLAYVAYNTGHERQALGYLDLAEKRAPEQAAFYKLLREHWALPDGAAKPAEEGTTPKPETAPKPSTELRKPELNK